MDEDGGSGNGKLSDDSLTAVGTSRLDSRALAHWSKNAVENCHLPTNTAL